MKKLMITVNGKRYEVDVEVVQDDDADVYPAPRAPRPAESYVAPVAAPPPSAQARGPAAPSVGDKKSLASPVNGVILEIAAAEGKAVQQGDALFVLEAMKMKTTVSSPESGTISSIKVKTGDRVEAGQLLLTFA